MRVCGIGGVFLYADDPDALAAWYARAFGLAFRRDSDGNHCVDFEERDARDPSRVHCVALTVCRKADPAVRKSTTMVNYRIEGLDALLARLREQGVAIEGTHDLPFGRFAWLKDGEGNPVEVYEPAR